MQIASPHGQNNVESVGEIVDAVERHGGLLLLLVGFDGVLTEYNGDPAAVRLAPEIRRLLDDFRRQPTCVLGIVSGRQVSDLRSRVGIDENVFYVGLHGLEVQGPSFALSAQEINQYEVRMHEIAAALERSMSSVPGVRVEDKGAVVAVHTRQAGSVDAVWARLRVLNVAADLFFKDELRILRGNHVFELMPNAPASRPRAITAIHRLLEERQQRPVLTLYIGEDAPDDDAFEVVSQQGITIAVGCRTARAQYHFKSTTDVRQLIETLATARSPTVN
jgi:trehalose 6-phosphate phosphatase